jgi:transketolase
MNNIHELNKAADNIRILVASMVEKAKSSHPGGAMGGADFVNVLFSEFLVYDPKNPAWEGRDRFFLDPGHMSMMLYATLALTVLKHALSPCLPKDYFAPKAKPYQESILIQSIGRKIGIYPGKCV